MFPKRKRIVLEADEVKTLKLREFDNGNRLTVDKGSERIDLASNSSEIEREWLFEFIQKHYP